MLENVTSHVEAEPARFLLRAGDNRDEAARHERGENNPNTTIVIFEHQDGRARFFFREILEDDPGQRGAMWALAEVLRAVL